MRQAPSEQKRPVETVVIAPPYAGRGAFLWDTLLSLLLLSTLLLCGAAPWGNLVPRPVIPILISLVSLSLCRVSGLLRFPALKLALLLIPWVGLFIAFGYNDLWQGVLLWINYVISAWNALHDGGLALFAANATLDSVFALSCTFCTLCGQLTFLFVSRRKMFLCSAVLSVLLLLLLLTGTLTPLVCILGLLSIISFWLCRRGEAPSAQGLRLIALFAAALCAYAVFAPRAELKSVTSFRENTAHEIHTLRYGEDLLPEGNISRATILNQGTDELMTVEQELDKTLYLRGYVGAVYADGKWSPLPDSAYAGEYAGMLDWLRASGFDPLTQPAQYARLTGSAIPNLVEISVSGASRFYVYSTTALDRLAVSHSEKNDTRFSPTALIGVRDYSFIECSDSRPAELTVRAEWVSNPVTEQQLAYADAEAVYREFVYSSYSSVDPALSGLMQTLFWDGYEPGADGIYSAVDRVRTVLRERTVYSRSSQLMPPGVDPIRDFLTGSRSGNAVLYASAAVEALRAYGIPSRYVEGYYVPSGSSSTVTAANAHAWVEVYFDGIGWLPIDVTPGYYYDAVSLQEMVALPDAVHKTASVDDGGSGPEEILDESQPAGTELPEPLVIIENTLLVLLGIFALLILVLSVFFAMFELSRICCEHYLALLYRSADSAGKVEILRRRLFDLLSLWGIDACLGWNTEETDKTVSELFPEIKPGEYARACRLIEKSVYGGLELEPYEQRTLETLLKKLRGTGRRKDPKTAFRVRFCALLRPIRRRQLPVAQQV